MIHIIDNIPVKASKNIKPQILSCMPNCNRQVCSDDILKNAAKVKQALEEENAIRDDIIKESTAAKAYLGLK